MTLVKTIIIPVTKTPQDNSLHVKKLQALATKQEYTGWNVSPALPTMNGLMLQVFKIRFLSNK